MDALGDTLKDRNGLVHDEVDKLYSEVAARRPGRKAKLLFAFLCVALLLFAFLGLAQAVVLNQRLQLVNTNVTTNLTSVVERTVVVEVPCNLSVVKGVGDGPELEPCYESRTVFENVTTSWLVVLQDFRTSECRWDVGENEWCYWDAGRAVFVCKNLLRCDSLPRVEPSCEFKTVRQRVSDGCTPLIQSMSKNYPEEYKETFVERLSRKTGRAIPAQAVEP